MRWLFSCASIAYQINARACLWKRRLAVGSNAISESQIAIAERCSLLEIGPEFKRNRPVC